MDHKPDRRQALKIITIGGVATTLLVPSKWMKPVVEAIIVPAHAQASPPATSTTGTSSSTTSSTSTIEPG